MCDEDKTSNSVQACSDLAHVVLVLVGVRHVRRVTVVQIGLEGVLVVTQFCVAITFVNCCIRRCSLYSCHTGTRAWQCEGSVSIEDHDVSFVNHSRHRKQGPADLGLLECNPT